MTSHSTNVALIFPGQGAQSLNMGKDFYDQFPLARQVYQEVDEVLGYPLSQIIFGDDYHTLCLTKHAQPALMANSIAILRTLLHSLDKSISEICSVVAGHSLGEYSALCAAGSLTLAEVAIILKTRGEAMESSCPAGTGGMAALLGTTLEQAQELILLAKLPGEVLVIANDNSIGQIVISGHLASINQAVAKAPDVKIKRVVKLPVSGPFHSPLMQPAAEQVSHVLADIELKAPQVRFIANVSGKETINLADIKPMLIAQIVGNVKWRHSIEEMTRMQITSSLEIGSGSVLSGLIKRITNLITPYTINNLQDMHNFIERYQNKD